LGIEAENAELKPSVRRRFSRRAALRRSGMMAAAVTAGALLPRAARAQEAPPTAVAVPAPGPVQFGVSAGAAELMVEFDPESGAVRVPSLTGDGQFWVPSTAPRLGCLWIDGVAADGADPIAIDGGSGLELLSAAPSLVALLHRQTGLQLELSFAAAGGNSIVHRLALTNAGQRGNLRIATANTLSLPVWAGDVTEALSADDAPGGWSTMRRELPISYGHHGSRSGDSGVYPIVRLETLDGHGVKVAVE
jgi:hypothetical protein